MGNKIWVCDEEVSARFPVYSRGNVAEVYSDVTSPLTWSAYGPHVLEAGCRDAFYEMGVFAPEDFRQTGQCDFLGRFGGYVYLNISVSRVLAVRIPGMTTEAIDKGLFWDYPDVPPYRPDARDQNAARTAAVGAWLTSLFTTDPKPATDGIARSTCCAKRPISTLPDAQLLGYRSLRTEGRQLKRHALNTAGANVSPA
jgi:pyruvate,water dikinase